MKIKKQQPLTEAELKAIAKKVDDDICEETKVFMAKLKAEEIAWRKNDKVKDGHKNL